MWHLKIWVRSLLSSLFICLLLMVPILIVADDITIEDFYIVLPVVVLLCTITLSVIGYRNVHKKKHK